MKAVNSSPIQDPFNVDHAIVHRLQQCSTNPGAAAEFSIKIFHPSPQHRLALYAHCEPYLCGTTCKLQAMEALETTGEWHCFESPT